MNDDIQLVDLLPKYPSVDEENFQELISGKHEFEEMASGIFESPPSPGEFFKHQILIQRFMEHYDELNLFHETGSGKSCAFFAAAEWFKKQAAKGGAIKRVIVITKGPSLKSELKHQLACKCTSGEYITKMVKNSKTESSQKSNVTREINKWYEIVTSQSFANSLSRNYPTKDDESRMVDDYSGTFFIVDEVHDFNVVDADVDDDEEREKLLKGKEQIYNQIWRLFHLVQRSKKLIASATPMVNGVREIGSIMNLILPRDNQFPPNFDYDNATLETMEPYLRGRVSYVRAFNTGAILVEQENPDPRLEPIYEQIKNQVHRDNNGTEYNTQLKLFFTLMSEFQRDSYLNAEKVSVSKGDIFESERQAANFTFPITDKTTKYVTKSGERMQINWGGDGFKQFLTRKGQDKYEVSDLFINQLDEYGIGTFSSKYESIINRILECDGNVFVYGEFVATSGVVVLGKCLEYMDFSKFDETGSVLAPIPGARIKPYCAGGILDPKDRKIRQDFPKMNRYALLTKETSDSKFASMMEIMNSPENMHGEYIKVFISSRVGKEGINVNNVLQIQLIGAEWNQSTTYQATSRASRATSHVDLIEEERERLAKLGEDPDLAKLEVKVFKHVAFAIDEENEDARSRDLEMYYTSEGKDREIKKMIRIIKQISFDCLIHYDRNYRPDDIDGTPVCDYTACEYKCFSDPPKALDYSSFDVLYSDNIVSMIVLELKKIFREIFVASIQLLH